MRDPVRVRSMGAAAVEEDEDFVHDEARLDPEKFESFYRANVDRIYRALAVALRNDDLAREAVDEAMVRAYARWPAVTRLESPSGWVFRVGLNWGTSWWRKVRRERPPVDETWPGSTGPAPDGVVVARGAISQLPTGQRAVVICRILLDLSIAETAAALGLSEGTVKSRLSRGICALRSALSDKE